MTARLLRLLVVLLAVLTASASASAQMAIAETIDSIDARVLNAKTIVVGKVIELSEPTLHGTRKYRQRDVTVVVEEILKGTATSRLRFTPRLPDAILQDWMARSARVLVDVPSDPKETWFEEPVVLDDPRILVPTADFTILRNPEEILRYVRDLIRKSPRIEKIDTFLLHPPPGPEGEAWRRAWPGRAIGRLRVPVDERLARRGRERIRGKGVNSRVEGVQALRSFKSVDNATVLRSLLGDPDYVVKEDAETNNGIEVRAFPVRKAAYEILQAWGESLPKPAVEEGVSRLSTLTSLYWDRPLTDSDLDAIATAKALTQLSLQYSRGPFAKGVTVRLAALSNLTELTLPPLSVGDKDIPPLSRLPNLRLLVLDGNPITDAGAKALASFPPSLKVVSLEQSEATDAGLAALRADRLGLRVLPDSATSIIGVYVERRDVEGLQRRLHGHPEEVSRKSWSGGMPLHQAVEAYSPSVDVVRILLDRGASVDALDWAGRTPLQTAIDAILPSPAIIRLLLERSSDPNRPNAAGVLPLERAVLRAKPEIVRLLLAAGADPGRLSKERLGNASPCPECLALIARADVKKVHP